MKYKVMYQNNTNYRGINEMKFFVLETQEGLSSILYTYPYTEKKPYPQLTYPLDMQVVNAKNVQELNKDIANSRYIYHELSGTPESYNLYIPKKTNPLSNVEVVETRSEGITDEMLCRLKQLKLPNTIIVIGEDYDNRKKIEKPNIYNYNYSINQYFCLNCKKMYNYNDVKGNYREEICPHCKAEMHSCVKIVSKSLLKNRDKELNANSYSYANYNNLPINHKTKFLFITKHPEDENGVAIYKMYREVSASQDKVTVHYGIEACVEHIVGKKMVCNKYLKKSVKEADPFDALNINTKNIMYPGTILYNNANNFMEFALENEKFLKMSGFQTVLKYSSISLGLEAFFIVFICIMNKYPVMEQIVKMGHAKIFFSLYKSIIESLNKAEIQENVEKISQIVDNEAKEGKKALRFPSYIGDYLIKKDASFDEYYYWRDIYEITNISKEQFENLTDSFNYAWINSQADIGDICNILKYDYSIEKLFNYIMKQHKNSRRGVAIIINYLTDYLNMCDICDIEADKYPSDLQKVHNDMLKFFKDKERAEYDKKLSFIGIECEKYVIPDENELDKIGIPKLFNEMTVVFPKCEADFINEGNQQHNCVGSYPRRVREGQCVIFFIRKKDDPEKSFITAECTPSGLGQCYYSNNRYVNDENLRKFAKYICNKIKAGVSSGQIKALK